MRITKTVYVHSLRCPKLLWLSRRRQDVLADDTERSEEGNEVGDLAMSYFGPYYEIPYGCPETMVKETAQKICEGVSTICEASFQVGDLFCSADILRLRADGSVDIYEVKSSTSIQEHQIKDCAFQFYVISKAGYRINSFNLMHLDGDYIFDGNQLELEKLFMIEEITSMISGKAEEVEVGIARCYRILLEETEPESCLSLACDKPFGCPAKDYCYKANGIPEESVFSIAGMAAKKKYELFGAGFVTPGQLSASGRLTSSQLMQIRDMMAVNNEPTINVDGIRQFLTQLRFPIYHLDFETTQMAIPRYAGMKPYEQCPFQYSLHIMSGKGCNDPLEHREFLAVAGQDPRRHLAEQIVRDIPADVMTMAYNKRFECSVLKALATRFPDLADGLLAIANNMVDLMIPFQKRFYTRPCMCGSYSIKAVLPAMCGTDPSIDYHRLPVVHNGVEAMTTFAGLEKVKDPEEVKRIREGLLLYCGLDTFAMVRVLQELFKIVEN